MFRIAAGADREVRIGLGGAKVNEEVKGGETKDNR